MKRKFILVLLAVVSAVCLAIGLSACGVSCSSCSSCSSCNSSEGGTTGGDTDGDNPSSDETHTHDFTRVEAVQATCTKEGNIEYWYCSGCGKSYADVNGTVELSAADIVVEKTAHTAVTDEAVAATCTSTGLTEGSHCSVCGTVITEQQVVAKTAHTYNGYGFDETSHWQECTVCGEKTESVSHSMQDGECTVCDYAEGMDFTLSADEKYYTVSGIGTVTSSAVKIPDTYNGLPVTAVDDSAFKDCTSITSVTIGDNVTKIGDYAFYGCSSLEEVTFGSGLKTVGKYAFANCIKLILIVFGDSVTTIEDYAFYGCIALTDLTIPANIIYIGIQAFGNCKYIVIIIILGTPTICKDAFAGCTLVTDLTLSDGLMEKYSEVIETAFPDSSSLTEVKDSDGTTYHAHELTHTERTEATCTEEGNVEYWYCPACDKYFSDANGTTVILIIVIEITEHTYEAAVTEPTCTQQGYTTYTCSGCGDSYKDNYVAANGHTWDDGVVTVEATCTEIGVITYTCTVCDAVKTESIAANGHNYGSDGVCTDCGEEAVASVGLEYTLSDDENYYIVSGMGDCTDTEIVIPNTYDGLPVEQIADKAFYGNTAITSVYMAGNVTYIGENAFYGCTLLVIIVIGKGVTTIGNYAFYNCTALTKITVYAAELEDFTYNNYVFYKAGQNGDGITVTIGASVTKIPAYMFCPYSSTDNVPKIVSVAFEDNSVCESIGINAFAYCVYIINITIPDSVITIGINAFTYCKSIENVYYGGAASQWASISFYHISSNPLNYAGGNLYLCGVLAKDITIEGITTINDYAFYNCSSLTSVTISKGVTSIGGYVFYGCTSLKNITISNSVTSIGSSSFYNTAYYNDSSNWEDGVLYIDSYLIVADSDISGESSIKEGTTVIVDNAYADCSSLTSVTIPDSVMFIGENAFYYCTSLKSVTIPDSVTSIGKYAFRQCTSLTSVTIGKGVTSIGGSAFYDCTALTEINFNATAMEDRSSVSSGILYNAGQNSEGITVTIGANVTNIPACLFDHSYYITSVIFEQGSACKSIGSDAFDYCTSLKSVIIPDSVTSIGASAFFNCTSLTSLIIGEGVITIGYGAFSNCYALTEINFNATAMEDVSETAGIFSDAGRKSGGVILTIGANVTKIPACLFGSSYTGSAPRIISVVFEDGSVCESIGAGAFDRCIWLTSVMIGNSVNTIGGSAFTGCDKLIEVYNLSSLEIVAGSTNYGYVAYYAKNVYTATNGESHLVSEGDYLFYIDSDNDTYYLVSYIGSDTELVLPDLVVNGEAVNYSIYANAFYMNQIITSVSIPDCVIAIGDYAFYSCIALKYISIPDSVTSIGSYAFHYCSIKSITIPDSVNSIGNSAFSYCYSLTDIVIPYSVISIGSNAFSYCRSLTDIVIPYSVISIGSNAFYECSSLESVYYTGTAEEWEAVTIGAHNEPLETATIYYYSETQPYNSGNYWHYVDGEIVIWEVIIHTEHTYEGYSYDDDNHWQVCSVCEEQTEAEAHIYGSDNICTICGLKKSSTGLKYVLSSDGTYYSVRGIGDCTDTDVVIPLTYNGLPVTEILAFAFMNNTTLTSITLSDNITSVSSGVIRGCTSLINIYVSEGNTSYKSIDGNLYSYDGTYLMQYAIGKTNTSFVIPEHVTYIYTYAFYGCANIVSVTISDNVRTIGNNAFSNCTSLKYITLSNNLISTGTTAFSFCTALESIVIPDSVISINGNAFERCESLKNIIIGSSVSTISSNAFDGCISLTSITLPESVESIGKQAFQNCTLLESISIGSNVTYIGYSVFEGTAFYDNESNWDNGVLYLGNYLIDAKTSISGEYTIKDGTTTIAYSAFADCTLLESITIPDSVVNIGNGAFDNTAYYNNENNWEDGVLYIGSCLIEANTSIYGNYTIKDGTTVIADNAFYNCTSLSVINIPNSVTAIGEYAFYYCIADIVWGDNPEITELGRYSFAYYQGYFLTIPDSVTVIKDHAIWHCTSIENLIIPDSVTFIGDSGIYSCTSLNNIILSGNLTAVSGRAFYNSTSLTSIIIPDGVTSIGDYSFTSCTSLTAIVIPDSVELIDYHAFYNCSSLESVYYTGTAEEWEAVTIGADNKPLETATIYYYSETQPSVSGNYWHYNSSGEVEVWNV